MARASLPNAFAGDSGSISLALLDANFSSLAGIANDSSQGWCNVGTDTGVANAYVVANASPFSSYRKGALLCFAPVNTNTGASTVNADGLGSVSIFTVSGAALNYGALVAGKMAAMVFDGTNFRIISPVALTYYNGTASGAITLPCGGVTTISVALVTTAAVTLALTGLESGVPVSIELINGAAGSLTLTATNPAGTAYSSVQWRAVGGTYSAFAGYASATGVSISFKGATFRTTDDAHYTLNFIQL